MNGDSASSRFGVLRLGCVPGFWWDMTMTPGIPVDQVMPRSWDSMGPLKAAVNFPPKTPSAPPAMKWFL